MISKAQEGPTHQIGSPSMATAVFTLDPADNGRVMTLDEFLGAEEQEGYRYELARGMLEVTDISKDAYREIVCRIYDAMSTYRRTHLKVIHRYGGAGEFRFGLPGAVSARSTDVAVVLMGSPSDLQNRR